MEGQLVQKTFTVDEISFDCWVIKIDKFWFKAHDIAVFLGHQNPNDAVCRLVPSEARKSWDELRVSGIPIPLEPPNWQPHTILISEGGLYRLLCKSTKPAAIKFERWVFDDLLPTLRVTGTYTIHQHLQFLTQQLTIKDEQLAIKDEQLTAKDELLAIKDEQLAIKDEQLEIKEQLNVKLKEKVA